MLVLVLVLASCSKSPESGAHCGKDTDCKGERICRSGECVDPAAVAATRTGADECQVFAEKSRRPLAELMGKEQGFSEKEIAGLIEACRKQKTRDPALTCVLAANTDEDVRKCYQTAMKDSSKRSRNTEAILQLNKIGKNAKVHYYTNAAFPVGRVALTPSVPCCRQFDNKCATGADKWRDPVWVTLDFEIYEPHNFQYSWESDGQTFKATAVGDPECSGKVATIVAKGTSDGGNVNVTITE